MASVRINVLDPEFYVDPWQAYRWLRDEAPVYWDPVQKLWVISRYDDVLDVEKDTVRYSSSEGSRPLVDQREDRSMINMDGPEHQEQRRLVSRWFTPRAMRGHESHVRDIVTGILDAVAPLGQCEAIEAIASRLPAIMISDLLGYPRELWERVRYWSEQTMMLSGQTSPDGPPHEIHPDMLPVIGEFAATTIGLIEARRAEPRDDLLSVWTHTPQPPPRFRRRDPPVPGRAPGPARDPRPVRGVAAADAGLGAGLPRRAADRASHLHPRLRPDPHYVHPVSLQPDGCRLGHCRGHSLTVGASVTNNPGNKLKDGTKVRCVLAVSEIYRGSSGRR